jgi:hypothetical protein
MEFSAMPNKLLRIVFWPYLLILVSTAFWGCKGSKPFMPTWPVDILLSAPEESEVQGRTYVLETELWRDFMPFSPPDGKPLIALIRVCARDSAELPAELDIARLWVIKGKDMWETRFSGQAARPNLYTLERVARDGPKWGPNVRVDVVAGLVHEADDKIYLLRASDQLIFRTE